MGCRALRNEVASGPRHRSVGGLLLSDVRADDINEGLEAAVRAAIRGDLPEAERLLRATVQGGGARLAGAWANLAAVLAGQDRPSDSDAEAARALAVWDAVRASGAPGVALPAEVEGLTTVLIQAGRAPEAVAVARAAAESSQHDPRVHAALGVALRAVGEQQEAAAAMLASSARWLAVGDIDLALRYADLAGEVSGPTPAVALAAARALAAKGQGPEARQRYEQAVAGDPSARAPAFEAELARIEGRPRDALAQADAVLEASPGDVEALAVRAQVFRDLGHFPEAIETLDRLLDAGGGDRFRLLRASLRAMIGDGEGALADMDGLGPTAARSPLVHMIRAEFLLHRGRYVEAIEHFDISLSLEPGHPWAKGERALALFGLGRGEEARSQLDALLADPPADADVRAWIEGKPPKLVDQVFANVLIMRGRLRFLTGDLEGARRDLAAGISEVGPLPDAVTYLAQTVLAAGEPADALAATEAVAPAFAATPDILRVRALALARLERYEEALDAVRQTAKLGVEDAEMHHLWALILRGLGRDDEALGHFLAAEDLGGDAGVFNDHAMALQELERVEEAAAVTAAATERFPEEARVFALRGTVLAATQDPEGAAQALTRSLELDPDQPGVAAELGETFRRLERYDQALEWLDRALEGDPGSSYALGTKGQVLRAQGRNDEALPLLREAVRLAGDAVPGWLVQEIVPALHDLGTSESLEEALEHLHRYLAGTPTDTWALMAKAESLRLLERPTEGLESIDAALEAARGTAQQAEAALGTKAHLLADLSRPEEALAVADQALSMARAEDRENTFALSARIRALIGLDRHQEAFSDIDRYLEIVGSQDPWGLMTKASMLSDCREFEAALHLLEEVESSDPFRLALVGYCRNRLGDHRGGIEALQAAIDAQDRVWWWWAELGEASWRAGDRDAARRAFTVLTEEASSSSATDGNLLANAAWAALRLDDDAAAVGHARRAVSLEPGNPAYRLILAMTLLRTGRGLAGQEEIEAAEALATERPDPRRGAAILEDAIADLEWLLQEGVLERQRTEADGALEALRAEATRLRQRAPALTV